MKILLLLLLFVHLYLISGKPTGEVSGKSHRSLFPDTGRRRWSPLDCQDLRDSDFQSDGEYIIYPQGAQHPLPVYCDMTTNGTTWTVFQKRFNGSVDFNQNWQDYLKGFGNADGEYWLGLQNIYHLTMHCEYELRVELEDFNGTKVYAQYSNFSLSRHALNAEHDGYRLYVDGFIDGGAGDSLSSHAGHMFSTKDRDQEHNVQNCAEYWGGGFWYHSRGCADAGLNARYTRPALGPDFSWKTFVDFPCSLRASQMKMRRSQSDN